jgi:hypothetical protein
MAGTGFILRFVLPPGAGAAAAWGLSRHQWGDLHFYASLALLAGVLLHLVLHWSWVDAMMRKRLGMEARGANSKSGLWASAILAFIVLALAWAVWSGRTAALPEGNRSPGSVEHRGLGPGGEGRWNR